MKPRHAQLLRETASDRFWREKIEECPECWRPFALMVGLVALALAVA